MKNLFISVGVLGMVFLVFLRVGLEKKEVMSIQVGDTLLTHIEVRDSESERAQGLSGREAIREEYGMLFVFENPGLHSFWMRDMKFSIDIIWLDEEGTVVGLKERATPESYPESFSPERLALYVLEVNSGLIAKESLKIGDKIRFSR